MITTSHQERGKASERIPVELVELKQKIQSQPLDIRAELEPLVEDALEHARFRGRAMSLARDALERFRLDMANLEFDLEVTRREREALKEMLER
jgi:hypothetical protein